MNTKYPLVSVIIPTFKRPDNLLRAIKSVQNQTFPNIEIIVVDDNGEGTEWQVKTKKELSDLIVSKAITYIAHKVNKNGSAARNTGFRASKGEYINFIDDDDILLYNKIAIQVNILSKTNKEIGATYATPIYIFKNRNGTVKEMPTYGLKDGDLTKDFLLGKIHFNTTGLLFKRNSIESLNGFDETYKRHQDYELMIRFARDFKMIHSYDKPLYYMDQTSYGIHGIDGSERVKFELDFVDSFKKDLVNKGILKKYMHFILWQCAMQFLTEKEYKKSLLCSKKSLTYGFFSYLETKELMKHILKNLVRL